MIVFAYSNESPFAIIIVNWFLSGWPWELELHMDFFRVFFDRKLGDSDSDRVLCYAAVRPRNFFHVGRYQPMQETWFQFQSLFLTINISITARI